MFNCKFCLFEDYKNNLISPCICSGNIKYVHRECLNNWRNINANNNRFYECEICKNKFIFEIQNKKINTQTIFFVLRLLLFNLFILAIIFIIGVLSKFIFLNEIIIFQNTYINNFILGILLISLFVIVCCYIIVFSSNIRGAPFHQDFNIIHLLNYKPFAIIFSILGFAIFFYYLVKLELLFIKNYDYKNTNLIIKDLSK
jgi:hypothetical protein